MQCYSLGLRDVTSSIFPLTKVLSQGVVVDHLSY
uniref:Uncharacterized protein n=1 Tax=Anguilla anguilla TaxID=7936 RepID=A0A0E9WCC3_ANGAN